MTIDQFEAGVKSIKDKLPSLEGINVDKTEETTCNACGSTWLVRREKDWNVFLKCLKLNDDRFYGCHCQDMVKELKVKE